MNETVSTRGRLRFSLSTLMILVAVCAFILVPVVWFVRLQRERTLVELERSMAEAARAQYAARLALAQSQWATTAQVASNTSRSASAAHVDNPSLWAVIAVNHPVFEPSATNDLSIEFTLVNDGDKVVDPKISESRIVINGKELADSKMILGNGPRDARFEALPPGESVRFSYALGSYFQEPGIYRVSWAGPAFHSPDTVFRVLPPKTGSAPSRDKN